MLFTMREMYVDRNPKPLPAAPAADSDAQVLSQWNAIYDAYNEMKGYVDQLERLGYMLPQDLIVGLILNGLTKDFARNYNMHNTGKTIGELHAMLVEYEKGLPKKAETSQVMMIKGGKIQKSKKKSLKAKGKGKANGNDKQVYIPKPKNPKPSAKEHPTKNDTCHHCKEMELFAFPNKSWVYDTGCGTHVCITKQGFREARKLKQGALYLYMGNGVHAQVEAIGSYDLVFLNGLVICLDNCHYGPSITRGVVSVHRLVENGFVECFTDFGTLVSKNNVHNFNDIPSNGIYEIDMHDRLPNVNSIYNISTKRAKHNLDSTYLWHCHLAHISKKHIEKLQQEGLLKSTDDESFDQCVSCLSDQGGEYISQEFKDYLKACGIVQQLTPPYTPQHNGDYALESATRIINMVPIKKFDKTPYELWYGKVLNLSYLKVEGFEPPQEEVIPIRRSERTHRALDHLCLNVEVEEHCLGDLNEPTIYKDAMLDSESNKRIDAMNAEIQSMIDNMVWVLVDLPPGCKTVGSKWIFKKKTDMDGIVHTYKARLVAKGYSQLYGVDYKETFSPFAEIRAIRILISIAAYYDYEIWQIDVKTAFLNGYLDEEIYMVQPKGVVDWKSSKQSTTAMSATEAEYIAASEAAMEAVWIRKFISGLGIVPKINEPIRMFCDNSATLHFANEPGVQKGVRHYHRRYHYVSRSICN
ncbi:retrotransposon protein, putative, ty1-copia subclass [Tanacetum coccineum]